MRPQNQTDIKISERGRPGSSSAPPAPPLLIRPKHCLAKPPGLSKPFPIGVGAFGSIGVQDQPAIRHRTTGRIRFIMTYAADLILSQNFAFDSCQPILTDPVQPPKKAAAAFWAAPVIIDGKTINNTITRVVPASTTPVSRPIGRSNGSDTSSKYINLMIRR